MSHKATMWAVTVRGITCAEARVLWHLADCHNPSLGCYPSQDYLAEACEMDVRSIRRVLDNLKAKGHVDWTEQREGRFRKNNRYSLAFEDGFCAASLSHSSEDEPDNLPGSSEASTGQNAQFEPDISDSFNRTLESSIYKPVREPVTEPVIERERVREAQEDEQGPEDRKKIEAAYWDLVKDWPQFGAMSKEPARKLWYKLTPEERQLAIERYPGWRALLKADKKSNVPTPQTYFRERLWTAVGAPPKPDDQPILGSIFSRPVGALRLVELLKPMRKLPPAPPIVQKIIDAGGEKAERQIRERAERFGWPAVNEMYQKALDRKEIAVPSAIAALSSGFEAVKVGGEIYRAWQRLHAARHWPFLPDPGKLEYVQFPAAPAGETADADRAVALALEAFERALIGVRGDEHAA